jgi:UrcA family protein
MTKTITAMLLALSTPVFAQPPEFVTSVVPTADLDLSSKAGQRALDHRLNRAAKEVCGFASDADVEGKNDVRRCRVETLARVASERELRIARASGELIEVATR